MNEQYAASVFRDEAYRLTVKFAMIPSARFQGNGPMLDAVTEFALVEDMARLDPKLRQLLAYWEHARPGTALPGRKDIDPIEIPRLMPHVALLDVLRDPLDYRYRLVGTNIVAMTGYDRTGKRAREIFPAAVMEATVRLLENLVAKRKPLAFAGRMFWIGKDYRHFEALVLPLASDGQTVDMAIMGLHFRNKNP